MIVLKLVAGVAVLFLFLTLLMPIVAGIRSALAELRKGRRDR